MVMERLDAARRHRGNQDPTRQFAIEKAKRILREADVVDPGPKVPMQKRLVEEIMDRLNLFAEWERQTERYVELGFHKELGLTGEEYLVSLPQFEPQPKTFAGRFDIPLLVETRIPPSRQAQLAGLQYYLGDLNVHDWETDPKKYKTPDMPYTTWMQDEMKNLNKSVSYVRQHFASDERGATLLDGIALYIVNPNMLKNHAIDLPGTSVDAVSAPCLKLWGSRPAVDYAPVGSSFPGFGSASCGRNEA